LAVEEDQRTEDDRRLWQNAVDTARTQRATHGIRLLALVPPDEQGNALRLLLELERDAHEHDQLQDVLWGRSVRQAYAAGCAREAQQLIETLTGEAVSGDTPPIMH
jgi:hypothetical protein